MRPALRRALGLTTLAAFWAGLLAYAFLSVRAVMAAEDLGAGARALNAAILVVEVALGAFGLLLLGAVVDAPSAFPLAGPPPARPAEAPRVTLLVPVFREDAGVLRATLTGARRLRWPRERLEVVVVDDTPEPALALALARAARAGGARYVHRERRRGFKAGALNDALAAGTGDVVAVLDVDHVPEPDWLERAVPALLADERAAFVQSRLAWRNADSPLGRLQAILQAHFYEVIQRAKESRGVAVFAGSGAVFRRAALNDAGGFPEDTLVEDFDVTVSLLSRGWRGRYLPVVAARGLLPWTSADLARQLWRWAHGTTRILVKRGPFLTRGNHAGVDWRTRVECTTDAFAYTAAGLFVLAGVLLTAIAGAGVALPRAAPPLVGPALVLVAHSVTAAVALHRAGERGYRWVVPYHLMSVAFTPVVFAATLAAYAGIGQSAEGRVAKNRADAGRRGNVGPAGAAFVAGGLGLGLIAAAFALWGDGGAWVWAGQLGVAFTAPAVVGVVEGRRLRQ